MVVVTAFEPAVVNDKALHPQRGRFIRHPHDVFRVVVKVDPLPGVEMHRARFVLREADDVGAQIAVELLAHAVQTVRGVAGVEAWRPQGFPLLHRHFTRQVERFGLQITAAIGFGLRAQAMIAAPAQMHAPDVTLHFAKARRAADQRREMLMGAAAPAVLNHKAVVLQQQAMRLKLADPAAMESHHLAGPFRQRQGDGQTLHLPRLAFEVGQAVANRQHAAVIKGDLAGQTQASGLIFGGYGKRLPLLRDCHGPKPR